MINSSLYPKLYKNAAGCLHLEGYQILAGEASLVVCGACYFRDGVIGEVPTRINRGARTHEGLFGAPTIDPKLVSHLFLVVGLVPPAPHQSMREFRRLRSQRSKPNPKLYPFTTALWRLMGYQPPLARVLLLFCEGKSEIEIANEMDLSLYNVHDRLRKAVHTGRKYLRQDGYSFS